MVIVASKYVICYYSGVATLEDGMDGRYYGYWCGQILKIVQKPTTAFSQFPDILAFEPAAALGYSKEKPSPRQKLEGPYTILQYSDFGFHMSFSQPVVWVRVPDVKESRVCWASTVTTEGDRASIQPNPTPGSFW